jgi:hypothetical protein
MVLLSVRSRPTECTALEGGSPSAPGVLAPVQVILSWSIITYSTPSVPLAGTSRLHHLVAYTQCLRCAGAPRRPTRGSELSLHIPSWHAVLIDPGEFVHRMCPIVDADMSLRRDPSGSALSKYPAIRCTQGTYFGASRFTYATACQVARPPLTDRTGLPSPRGLLLSGFRQPGRPCRR